MGVKYQWEPAGKPGSVPAAGLPPPRRQPFLWAVTYVTALATYPQASAEPACSAREFVHTALAYLVLLRMEVAAFHPPGFDARRLVSVALFVTSPCQGVTLHPALRSPDFPLCLRTAAAWPTPVAILPPQADPMKS